jgi:RNA polymerase sigma factor for flagellar operon FliA
VSLKESELIEQYLPLIRRIALRLLARLPASVELDDLIQAGSMGLLDAVRKYRKMPHAQFATYATQRIRGAMMDELRGMDWLSRGVREKARRIEDAMRSVEARTGQAATEAAMAEELGVSLSQYHEMLQDAHGAQLLYAEDLSHGQDESGHDWIFSDQGRANPLNAIMQADFRTVLIEALEKLPEREKLLLSLLYQEDMNLKEVALVLGVTEGRVCQLRTQAMARIRACMASRDWDRRDEAMADERLLG